MSWKINLDVVPSEAHSELLNQIELADLSWVDAQAARTAVNAALSFLNVVGDPSRDPAVTISLEGDGDSFLSVHVDRIAAPPPEPQPNVPTDASLAAEAEAEAVVSDEASDVVSEPVSEPVPAEEPAPVAQEPETAEAAVEVQP